MGREVNETIRRSQGDGSGFKLTLFPKNNLAEYDFKISGKDYRTIGDITFQNTNFTNLIFDFNKSYQLGLFPTKTSPTLVSILLNHQDNSFFRSVISSGPIKTAILSGGKCNEI